MFENLQATVDALVIELKTALIDMTKVINRQNEELNQMKEVIKHIKRQYRPSY
jgi:uncharacterized protein (DUF305 family)